MRFEMKSLFLVFLLIFSQLSFADISLSELGMSTEPDKNAPSLLPKEEMQLRTSKLKTHEVLGLVTLGAMTATLLTGNSVYDNNMHMYLGFTTGALYMATAYYSLTAPKPMGVIDRGRIKWHKGLAWVHFPLMIMVPYIGYMYKKNEEDGKEHSSLEKQHRTLAGLLYGTFAISAALMVVEF
jgi:hypothetical protein